MHLLASLLTLLFLSLGAPAWSAILTRADDGPYLKNGGMECVYGYYDQPGIPGMAPLGWTAQILRGAPHMGSVQMWLTGTCKGEPNNLEKLEGYDSLAIKAVDAVPYQDFDAPPFDVALYQQVKVQRGADYSLSAWMVSFCGGTATPSSCPGGNYIAKMAALDPNGGKDPTANGLQWAQDTRPHTEAPWTDLKRAATATSDTMTVFVRINSPFHFRGNYAHVDAVKLVRAPNTQLAPVSISGRNLTASWSGDLGPDIPLIPAGTHRLSFEVEVRRDGEAWTPWLRGVGSGQATYTAPVSLADHAYRFRVRAWAIQPSGQNGSWPFHEFVGVWKESGAVSIAGADLSRRAYLPALVR